MKLSIIIVNYNVKFFLQQCLTSVFNALKKIESEVWVVDNNSVDGSVKMIKNDFPQTKLLSNKKNVGFSKANNQAIKKSKGEYVVLLNPDTIVEETTFEKVVNFMDKHTNAGGLGVKMIDGKGNFLPESKRGVPTPEVSFYKMFGLTKLFPKSKRFAKYYYGHLSKDETNKVEVLSGAFMMLRKKVLDKIGYLDESFFMYGEDIDLSYRILKAGYDNYYFSDTTIVHYKGESTKKGSLNYVYVFYNAMIIFAKKHFANKNARFFMILIKFAIILRASLSVIRRILLNLYLPLLDLVFILSGFYFIVPLWEKFHLSPTSSYPDFIWIMIPIYTLIWLISSYYSGAYDKPVKLKSILSGVFLGTAVILIFYALIDVKYRFSRALILLGAAYAYFIMTFIRLILHWFRKYTKYSIYSKRNRKIFIVGDIDEARRVKNILDKITLKIEILGFISPDESFDNDEYIANLSQIEEVLKIYNADEVIFCSKNMSSKDIINRMLKLSSLDINVKIAPKDSVSIIGSNSINTAGDLYILDLNTITKPENQRYKWLIDKILSVFFLVFYLFVFWLVKNKFGFFKNIFRVLFGKYSWVGFYKTNNKKMEELPNLKNGVLTPAELVKNHKMLNKNIINHLNVSYAKNYNIGKDFFIIFKGFKNLGNV